MTPEENLAARLLKRHSITEPPFNLADLVNSYADIRYERFPTHAQGDGIVLNLKKGRAKILINTDRPNSRQRFTLAHELGHIVIPWHTGNIVSNTSFDGDNYAYRTIEAEANRFASELLIPSTWLEKIIQNFQLSAMERCLKEITNKCKVSRDAALIKLFSLLAPGFIVAEVDEDGNVVNHFISMDTAAPIYNLKDFNCDLEDPFPQATKRVKFTLGNKRYLGWSIPESIKFPISQVSDSRCWREILEIVMEDTQTKSFHQSINATCASACQATQQATEEDAYAYALNRFSGKPNLLPLFEHELFHIYLIKRIRELRLKWAEKLTASI